MFSASHFRMRPYTGVGVLLFSSFENMSKEELQIPLYEEPGISRIGVIDNPKLSGNEWVFGVDTSPPLIVSARKGAWLQVYYDDAGRKAWISPLRKGHFLSWEKFLKLQTCRMLPGLQSAFYRLQKHPDGDSIAIISTKQQFKVLKLENDWGMLLTEQGQIGWVRWRDDDGRLTMGVGKQP